MLENFSLDMLKKYTYPECRKLCKEVRRVIIRTVSENGGHLASNLGAVELTVALHKNFNSPEDKIVWDVGHQSYAHKILTGRLKKFKTLRQEDGISGFPKPDESEHDSFITGHSSTAVSVACGLATGMFLNDNKENYVIAVVGDGAMTGGLFYEGLNNVAGLPNKNVIVILNHNGVSISKNVGAIAKYLKNIRHSENYVLAKKSLEKALEKTPLVGKPIIKILKTTKDLVKDAVNLTNMFENMGFVYLGPVDGHNLAELDKVLQTAKTYKTPVFIHVNTIKGKGYKPAEENPGEYHGVGKFNIGNGEPDCIDTECYSNIFGKKLLEIAKKDKRICAVTAAMKYGTGLQYFAHELPRRFFDVGIAESHAVTFAGALASTGKIPVFAVYASFLQRCYDQLIHDVALSGNHIVLAVDRFGIVGNDGETHQGIFTMNMLMTIPDVTIFTPTDYEDLEYCLNEAIYHTKGIAAVCYPRGKEANWCHVPPLKIPENTAILTYGRMYFELMEKISEVDSFSGIQFPVQEKYIKYFLNYENIVFVEEAFEVNGYADYFHMELIKRGFKGNFYKKALPAIVKQATFKQILKTHKLDADSIMNFIRESVSK